MSTLSKPCLGCGKEFALSDYWKNKRNRDGRDDWCPNCKKSQQLARENTPKGFYEMKGRLLSTIFKPIWFPSLDKTIHQVDHKFSLAAGYMHQVPLRVVGNPNNLQLLTIQQNRIKGSRCSISLDTLLRQADLSNPKFVMLADKIEAVKDPDQIRRWIQLVLAHQQNPSAHTHQCTD